MAKSNVAAIRPQSTRSSATVAAHEMCRLWQAHEILELAIHALGDEVDNGQPAVKHALRAAADLVVATIEELEPISTPAVPA